MAYDMGFTTLEPNRANVSRLGLSVALGGGEVRLLDMVSAYSLFSNGGRKIEPISILEVKDKNGKKLYSHREVKGKQVLSEQEAFLINHVLSDNNARLITFGEFSLLNIPGRSIAVKTGTTNDQRDNWTVGWTQDTVVGVWVGNNDNSPMRSVASGVSGAAPIWRKIIVEVLRDRPDKAFEVPSGVEAVLVDSVSGYKEHDGFASRSEYVIDGTLPSEADPIHTFLDVCKSKGLLATELDIAKGDSEKKEFFVFREDDPLQVENKWQQGIDSWLGTVDDDKYHPPSEFCDVNQDLVVSITSPGDKSKVDNNDVEIKITAVAADEIEWVKIYVNGEERETLTEAEYKSTLTLEKGQYTLKARARAKNGEERDSDQVQIGVKEDWEEED